MSPRTPELADCRRMLAQVWEQVRQFYARMGVNLVEVSGQAQPGPLAPAKRLRIELLPDRQWLNQSFKAFDVAPPFQLRFLQVCLDKCAFAHLQLSTIHVSFKRFQEGRILHRPQGRRPQPALAGQPADPRTGPFAGPLPFL